MENGMYASEDGLKLGIFEGDTNHLLLFEYIPSMDVVEVKIMQEETVEASFTISAHDNQFGRKYEGLIGVEHYFGRLRGMLNSKDCNNS